jgi:F-type H+-transporting ATPase subunit b
MEALHTLGIDFKVLIAQIINFGILIAVLTKLLYRPILTMLEQRRKRIEESQKLAEEIDKKAAKMEEEMKHKRDQAKSEAAEIVGDAKSQAEKDREQILLAAAAESDRVKNEGREQIELERQALYDETKRRVGKLALVLVTKSLQQDMGEEFYERNINKALKEIEAL